MTPKDIKTAGLLLDELSSYETTKALVEQGSEVVLTIDKVTIKLTSALQDELRGRIVQDLSNRIAGLKDQLAGLGVSEESS